MTQQFKFGDMVRHKEYGIGVVTTGMPNNQELYVDFNHPIAHKSYYYPAEELELIPHPDTVRLEILGRIVIEAKGEKFDLDECRQQLDAIRLRQENPPCE